MAAQHVCGDISGLSLPFAQENLHKQTTGGEVLFPGMQRVRPRFRSSRAFIPEFSRIAGGSEDPLHHDLETEATRKKTANARESARIIEAGLAGGPGFAFIRGC